MYVHLGGFMDILDLQPPTIEWRVYRNDTSTLSIAVVDKDENAIDLTDWTFTGQVREFPLSPTPITSLSIAKNTNILVCVLNTANLEKINHFDIQGTEAASGKISTIIKGTIFVEEDVTR